MKHSLFFLLFAATTAGAQRNMDGLLAAERAFAAHAQAKGTKDAFLHFADSNGIVFEKGQPVNALTSWSNRPGGPGLLSWFPHAAGLSASGDLGYTTGPWTFQPTPTDSVAVRGYFTTVWHLNNEGHWKFLLDLGVSNMPPDTDTAVRKNRPLVVSKNGSAMSLLDAENKFIQAQSLSPGKAYAVYMSPKAILHRNGKKEQGGGDSPSDFPQHAAYEILGTGLATSGELGYVFGRSVIEGKTDNYLRIWRRQKDGWKIELEVLRY